MNGKRKTITNSKFYCNQKFWWLSVDVEKIQTLSCCAATPANIDLTWLDKNPGGLFNTPELITERNKMLDNIPVASCQSSCWSPEEQKKISRRISMNGEELTHTNVNASPSMLHVIVGSHCNMTCVYCCKQYSTAWGRDIIDHGPYPVTTHDDRFTINTRDKILIKLSQKDILESTTNQKLFAEIARLFQSPALEEVTITGGEPFLYLGLGDLISTIPQHIKVSVWTGLGVNTQRLQKELAKICALRQINIVISAENTHKQYELIRYGNTWTQFENNVNLLKNFNMSYQFSAIISNLTIHGLKDFVEYAEDTDILYSPCNDPDYLNISVMDDASKHNIRNQLNDYPESAQLIINSSLDHKFTPAQKENLQKYLKEFIRRRNIDSSIFPQSFIKWASL